MDEHRSLIVWRKPVLYRASAGVIIAVCALLFVLNIVVYGVPPVQAYIWPVVALLNCTEFYRRTYMDDRRLVVRGRFKQRTIDLADVRQIGLSHLGWPWVQTHTKRSDGGDVTGLKMVPLGPSLGQGPPATPELVREMRRRAEAVGASLDPELGERTRPPTTKPLVIGM